VRVMDGSTPPKAIRSMPL